MPRLTFLIAAPILMLMLLFTVWGCAGQPDKPALPEEPVPSPAPAPDPDPAPAPPSPEEPVSPPGDQENDTPWLAAPGLESEETSSIEMEGMKEEISLQLQVSSLYPFALYLDEDRYVMVEHDGINLILPETPSEPEVFMAIWHTQGVQAADLAEELKEQLYEYYDDVELRGRVNNPLPAYYLYAVGGSSWDATVERYYVVEDFTDGVFIIMQKTFLEAVEGHGTRLDRMLEDFYVWNWQKSEFLQLN